MLKAAAHIKLEHFSHGFAKWAGSARGFVAALVSIVVWLFVGEAYRFSQGWENALTIYIGVITFLMIFLMQRAQNKELAALHIKLNELIAVTQLADNKLINAERFSEKEIDDVHETHSRIGMEATAAPESAEDSQKPR